MGDDKSGIGLGFFSRVHQALGSTTGGEYFTEVFVANSAEIQVFWAFDCFLAFLIQKFD